MQGCRIPVMVTTLFLLMYTVSPYLGVPQPIIAMAYVLAPFLVIWMVLRILIDGEAPSRTFEEGYWYDDETSPRSASYNQLEAGE